MRNDAKANGSRLSRLSLPDDTWTLGPERLCAQLDVDPDEGLTTQEVDQRLAKFGLNALRGLKTRRSAHILIDQFRSIVTILLCAAAAIALLSGDVMEGVAVLVVILINTSIGFFTELRATRSMEALRQLGQTQARVRRGGQYKKIPAEQLVPGDIVLSEAGDVISADLRLLQATNLQVDESTLTGESAPVAKRLDPLPQRTAVMERSNMLHKGSTVTRGNALGIVTATGYGTELGQIADLVRTAQSQQTPLQRRLNVLGRRLVWLMLGIAVAIALAGIATGRETSLAIQVAVALMIAAIPEGLPIVATIALARGMWRMAKQNALVVRLSAVETLGATGTILTDKTGTLTENRMTVEIILLPEHEIHVSGTGLDTVGEFEEAGAPLKDAVRERLEQILEAALLCNDADFELNPPSEPKPLGDPTEIALLVAAAKAGLDYSMLRAQKQREAELPFNSDRKFMATQHRESGNSRVVVKGAPEKIIRLCDTLRTERDIEALDSSAAGQVTQAVERLAQRGLRTLAVAIGDENTDVSNPKKLTLLGVFGILDPAREGVGAAISDCRRAGIRVMMVTGDHAATAAKIAADVGLLTTVPDSQNCVDALAQAGPDAFDPANFAQACVVARMAPKNKYDLVRYLQSRGEIVAMTGDGVNDAPALKQADIGIAMGQRGTPVAKEAAAMILQDDRFETIVEAVTQGRAIFSNIRKFVVYLLSCNLSEILVVGLATLAGAPLPLLPLQILFLNLVTDVFPALALGVGEGGAGQMRRPPRPSGENLLQRKHWLRIVLHGSLLSFSVLGAMAIALCVLGYQRSEAVTMSFCTLALGQLWHVLNMRDADSGILNNEVTRNPWIWAAMALCILLLVVAVFWPVTAAVLQLQAPPLLGWMVVFLMSALPLLLGPAVHGLTRV